jgi:phosphate transport system permease protein
VVGGSRNIRNLHSLPSYYGALTALWCAVPALVVLALWLTFQDSIIISVVTRHLPADVQQLPQAELGLALNDVRNVVAGNVSPDAARPETRAAALEYLQLRDTARLALTALVIAMGLIAMVVVRSRISAPFRARNAVERMVEWALMGASLIAVLTTVGIIASVAIEAMRFFSKVPWYEFLFGLHWSPQTAIRADQVGSSGAFGAVPLFWGTLMISGVAMLIAVPIGLFSAIYLAEYAHRKFRAWTKPFLEILAGIPTVVYGFFAALTVGPALRSWGEAFGLNVASESALAAGLVMGIMIVPFVSSLADDMIMAVPQSLRDGAYALGAT